MDKLESALNLQDLPTSVLQTIIQFIPEGETIFHLACTCHNAAEAIRTFDSTSLWEALHKHRWQIPSVSCTKDEYRRRHFIEAAVVRSTSHDAIVTESQLEALSTSTTTDTIATTVTMSSLEDSHELEDNIDVLQHPSYALELFWKANKHSRPSKILLALSTLHRFYNTMQENQDPEVLLLEQCLVLMSDLYTTNEDHYQSHVKNDTMKSESIKLLDKIAAEIQEESLPVDTSSLSIERVNQVLFGMYGFKGNSVDYYNYRNSLLHESLERKTGIPMTLALIYKMICRRLRIQVDIIGLPGHIVVHIPSVPTYLDVFRQGQRMTERECETIVNMYGYDLEPAFLEPLALDDILMRICKNLVNAFGPHPEMEQDLRLVQCLAYVLVHRNVMNWDEMSEYVCSRLSA